MLTMTSAGEQFEIIKRVFRAKNNAVTVPLADLYTMSQFMYILCTDKRAELEACVPFLLPCAPEERSSNIQELERRRPSVGTQSAILVEMGAYFGINSVQHSEGQFAFLRDNCCFFWRLEQYKELRLKFVSSSVCDWYPSHDSEGDDEDFPQAPPGCIPDSFASRFRTEFNAVRNAHHLQLGQWFYEDILDRRVQQHVSREDMQHLCQLQSIKKTSAVGLRAFELHGNSYVRAATLQPAIAAGHIDEIARHDLCLQHLETAVRLYYKHCETKGLPPTDIDFRLYRLCFSKGFLSSVLLMTEIFDVRSLPETEVPLSLFGETSVIAIRHLERLLAQGISIKVKTDAGDQKCAHYPFDLLYLTKRSWNPMTVRALYSGDMLLENFLTLENGLSSAALEDLCCTVEHAWSSSPHTLRLLAEPNLRSCAHLHPDESKTPPFFMINRDNERCEERARDVFDAVKKERWPLWRERLLDLAIVLAPLQLPRGVTDLLYERLETPFARRYISLYTKWRVLAIVDKAEKIIQ